MGRLQGLEMRQQTQWRKMSDISTIPKTNLNQIRNVADHVIRKRWKRGGGAPTRLGAPLLSWAPLLHFLDRKTGEQGRGASTRLGTPPPSLNP
ncbi:hypothetical protein CRG98_016616 [Punica granatum]|uniref:Uncharacterized protein n=1 Tax=Punica granatum TaxID=22663 RepID=A0A2I0K345_PUNGR|nr:hypothetical protein CRG98_016616 [Punica granatum]